MNSPPANHDGSFWGCGRKLEPRLLSPFRSLLDSKANRAIEGVGLAHLAGDVGQFLFDNDRAVVQTVDVVLPLPLEPEIWGQVAALHCLSDIYASGAKALSAVGIVGVGSKAAERNLDLVARAYSSAVIALNDEGVALVGGHSMWDDNNKIGFAIVGMGAQHELRTTSGAVPGDRIFLTKPIGFGAVIAASVNSAEATDLAEIERWMMISNRKAGDVCTLAGVKCASDVTGFGLLGTVLHIASDSDVTVQIDMAAVPLVSGARASIGAGTISTLSEAVWFGQSEFVDSTGTLEDHLLLVDPEVSGGLLVCVSSRTVGQFETAAAVAGLNYWEVGSVFKPCRGSMAVVR